MSLLELLGTPAPVRTTYPTRWNSQKVCVEVQCTCATWYRKTHNANCPYCNIDLVEQPAPATVATPEPAQVEQVQEVATPEPVVVAEDATEAVSAVQTSITLPGEVIGSFIRLTTTVDRPEYALKADQTFYLVHSESESTKAGQPVYHIVKWSYELKRWACPCGDVHSSCKHTKLTNQDCRNRAQQATKQQEAA